MSLNSFITIDPSKLDVVLPEHDGYPDELAAQDSREALWDVCGDSSREFPDSLWIEPKDWAAKARENDENHTWGMNYVDRFTNQHNTHECTWHSGTRIIEASRNRAMGIIFPDGPKDKFRYEESQRGSVWLSPMSGYNEANPRIRGGASIRSVLSIGCERGLLPDKIQPRDYGFKHTLAGTMGEGNLNQSSGPWVSVKNMPEGWRETAKHFKPLEVIFPSIWEHSVCIVLHGLLNGVGRDGHAIPWAQLIFEGTKLKAAGYPDSYNIIRYDSLATIKRAAIGSYAIPTTTLPDNWLKPTG